MRGRRVLTASKLFDPDWYRAAYELEPAADPLRHCLSGPADRRPSPWFDAGWYLRRYPDVGRSALHPLVHYVLFGAKEERAPNSHFATRWYLDNHPDAANALTPLDHYIGVGAAQLADPAPNFDAAWYAANVIEEHDRALDPLAHFLLKGRSVGAQTQPFFVPQAGEPIELARLETLKALEPAHGEVVAVITFSAVGGRLSADARALIEALAELDVRVVMVVEADEPFMPDPELLQRLAGGYVREARGRRYAAWTHLLRAEPLLFSGRMLLLLNGDVAEASARSAFKPLLRRLRTSTADVLGVMVPAPNRRRLDSDFLVFTGKSLVTPTIHNFFGALRSSDRDEREARADFEAKLTEAILSSSLQMEPLAESPLHSRGGAVSRPAPDAATRPSPRPHGTPPPELIAPGYVTRPSRPWKIAFIGPWNFASGLSQASRGNISALWRTGVRLNVHPIEAPFHVHKLVAPIMTARDFEGAADAVIIHLNPDAWGVLTPALQAVIDNARVRIGCWVWEMGHVPESWLPAVEMVDEIWTPSAYCAEVLSANTGKPVSVVPHVVPTPPVGASDRAAVLNDLGLEADARFILYSFDAASFIVRKNPQALIRAFAATGLAARGWRLVLKTKNLMDRQEGAALVRLAAETAGVLLIERQLDQEALAALFEAADIYASPHRSEGFGLTVAEAMAMGKHVVASDFAGVRDFLDASCGFPVPVKIIQNDQDTNVYPRGGYWADVSVTDFAAALSTCAAQVEAGDRHIGHCARARIEERLSADAVAGRMVEALDRALSVAPEGIPAA